MRTPFIRCCFGATLKVASALTSASGFFDLVRFESVTPLDGGRWKFSISTPGMFSEREVSWPFFCGDVYVTVPHMPQHPSISVVEHHEALSRLREAARTRKPLYFGPAGRGLVPSQDKRCELDAKAIRIEPDVNGKEVVFAFSE